MTLIEFGLIRKFLFFPFVHPFFCTTKRFFILKVEKIAKEKGYLIYYSIINILSIHLSLLFLIIPEIISRNLQKRKNLDLISDAYENSNLILRTYSNINLKIFLLILLTTLFYYPGILILTEGYYLCIGRFFLLFCLGFWSFFILKIKIHRHQIFGIILIAFGTVFLIFMNNFNNNITLINLILLIVGCFLFSMSLVIKKYLLEKFYVSPFFILLIEGIFGLLIDIIITFILIQFNKFQIEEFKNFLNILSENKLNYFYIIINSIFEGITQTLIIITNFYFTPTMIGISDYLSVFFEGILYHVYVDYYIGYFIIIIGCLIYNELIILKFCDFEIYTKKYIINRSTIDTKLLDRDDTDSEFDN